ncbi:hypothetical protein VPH35_070934 [Triticum aestivum]
MLAPDEPKDDVLSLLVFSSWNNHWESREFVPRNCTPQHLSDLLPVSRYKDYTIIWKSAKYWRGSLYVHCHNNILMIVRNSQEMYDMVQLPGKPCNNEEVTFEQGLPIKSILARYEKGIYYVAIDMFQLQVWTLSEPVDGYLAWTLMHEANLAPYGHQLENSDYSWNSDEDNFMDVDEDTATVGQIKYMRCKIVGLDPYKDVLLLYIFPIDIAMAYHLSTSRMQCLGQTPRIGMSSFAYRPCYMDALPRTKMSLV